MTEQEGEALAARLTRIWIPKGESHYSLDRDYQGQFVFYGQLEEKARIEVSENVRALVFDLQIQPRNGLWWYTALVARSQEGLMGLSPQSRVAQFVPQWMPFFRRSCWLSGCPIETSAHEKAEWMQGFSREELETWDLKM